MKIIFEAIKNSIGGSATVVNGIIEKGGAKTVAFYKRMLGDRCTAQYVFKHGSLGDRLGFVNCYASFKKWLFAFIMTDRASSEWLLVDLEFFVRLCWEFKRNEQMTQFPINEEFEIRHKVLKAQYA